MSKELESSLQQLRLEFAKARNERGQAEALRDHAQAECTLCSSAFVSISSRL